MSSITISHCSLGRGIAERKLSSSMLSSSISPGSSLRAATLSGALGGIFWAWCLRRSMSSTFFPEALIEWILQSLTSWSRFSECSAGELNKIWVVSDIVLT